MSDASGSEGDLGGMLTSGIIATVMGVGVILLLSFALPFPWSMGQTLISVAIASFAGAVVSFKQGQRSARG